MACLDETNGRPCVPVSDRFCGVGACHNDMCYAKPCETTTTTKTTAPPAATTDAKEVQWVDGTCPADHQFDPANIIKCVPEGSSCTEGVCLQGLCYSSISCAAEVTSAPPVTTQAPAPPQFEAPRYNGAASTIRITGDLALDGVKWTTLLTSRTKQVALRGVLDYVASSAVDDPFQRGEVYLLHASPSSIPGNSVLQYAYEKPPDMSYTTKQEIEAERLALVAVFNNLASIRSEISREPLLEGVSLSRAQVMSGVVFNVPEAQPTTAPEPTTIKPTAAVAAAVAAVDTQANSGRTTTIAVVVVLFALVVVGLGYVYRRRSMQDAVVFTGSTARVVVNEAYSASPGAQQQASGGNKSGSGGRDAANLSNV